MPTFCQRIQPRLGCGQYGSYGLPYLLIFMHFGLYTSDTAPAAAPCPEQVKRSSKPQNETKLKTKLFRENVQKQGYWSLQVDNIEHIDQKINIHHN